MDFNGNDEMNQRTAYCGKDFSCLKGNRNDLCSVNLCVDGKFHFIACHRCI